MLAEMFKGKESDLPFAANSYTFCRTSGAFTKEELAVYEPSFIINDLRELITIIDNIQ